MKALATFCAPAIAAGVEIAVDKVTLSSMAGAVNAALFNESTGAYWRMDPADAEKIGFHDQGGRWHWATLIDVDPAPTGQELALVGVTLNPETGRRDRLLGLFTGDTDAHGNLLEDPSDPPRIQLFAAEILAAGYDPVDVAMHEIGHRLRYNDEHVPAPPSTFVANRTLTLSENPCDFCALDDWLSTSERALYSLRERSHMQHQIPMGLGGRIPEVRERLERAAAALDRAERHAEISGRQGEIRALRGLIESGRAALEGDELGPQDMSRAHAIVARAWDANVDLGQAYYVALLHPRG